MKRTKCRYKQFLIFFISVLLLVIIVLVDYQSRLINERAMRDPLYLTTKALVLSSYSLARNARKNDLIGIRKHKFSTIARNPLYVIDRNNIILIPYDSDIQVLIGKMSHEADGIVYFMPNSLMNSLCEKASEYSSFEGWLRSHYYDEIISETIDLYLKQ